MLSMFSQACSYQISKLPISSTFIDFNDYSGEFVSLLMSYDVNVCGSFPLLVSGVYSLEGVLLNVN
jgi:hypothetical protein